MRARLLHEVVARNLCAICADEEYSIGYGGASVYLRATDALILVFYMRRIAGVFGTASRMQLYGPSNSDMLCPSMLSPCVELMHMLMNAYTPSGKTTFFVANQEKLEDVSTEKLADLEKQHKNIEEENKTLAAEVRALSTGTLIHVRNRVPKITFICSRSRETQGYAYRRSSGPLA